MRRGASAYAPALLGIGAALVLICWQCRAAGEDVRRQRRLDELSHKTAELRRRLDQRLASEAFLARARERDGNVLVALRAGFVVDTLRRLVAEYLDRVRLDLATEVRVQRDGEVKKQTRIGTLRAGRWELDLTLRRIQATLVARPPELAVSHTNRLRVGLPVRVERGEGTASVRFAWDAAGLASVVCGDFQSSLKLTARVRPHEYRLDGAFVLFAEGGSLLAGSEFPDTRLRLEVDLAPESWAALKDVLKAQDRWTKCGLALDPDDVIRRVKELLARGFEVRVPGSLLGKVELPTAVQRSVAVEGRAVEVEMRLAGFELAPDFVWWGVDVRAKRDGSSAGATKSLTGSQQQP